MPGLACSGVRYGVPEAQCYRRQRGLTLVELLVAMAVLAVLALGTSAILSSAIEGQSRAELRAQQLQSLGIATAIIQRDAAQMLLGPLRELDGEKRETAVFVDDPAAEYFLSFTKSGRMALPGVDVSGPYERVRYVWRDQALWRMTSPAAQPSFDSPWAEQRLLDEVDDIELRFFDGNRWHEQWPLSDFSGSAGVDADADVQAQLAPKLIALSLRYRQWQDIELLMAPPRFAEVAE